MHNPAVTKYDMHVISGGQTGVDLAALRVAQCLGLKTGGTAPFGFKTTAGPRPQLKTTFRLEEGRGGYSDRTRKNVERSQATLILAYNFESSGTQLTIAACKASQRPFFQVNLPSPAQGSIQLGSPQVLDAVNFVSAQASSCGSESFILNVAGNSSQTCKGIFVPAFYMFAEIMLQVAFRIDAIESAHLQQFRQGIFSNPQLVHALSDNYDYHGELDPRGMKGLII